MKIKLRKGLDIKLIGCAKDAGVADVDPLHCAIVPEDFPGLSTKVDVAEGDIVKVGSKLLHDKNFPEICLVSPVSGTVKSIDRGERRRIIRVVIESDGKNTQLWSGDDDSRHHSPVGKIPLMALLCRAGLFAQMRRRPYDVIPQPNSTPRDIFVTAFDSAPLAPSLAASIADKKECLETAVEALHSLTEGRIFISTGRDWTFGDIYGAEMVEVDGPHPAGNVGIQIANIAPINKGEEVWTLDILTLYRIGRLLRDGFLDTSVVVAVTGPEVENPSLVRTFEGAAIDDILKGRLKDSKHNVRIISGNVLTGTDVGLQGFLRFPWRQVTVIAEGDDADEFMGWASLSPSKLSSSPSFPFSRLRKFFSPDARLGGGRRAMILSGQYERVMPADIMVEYLIKAIISRNIEEMEALGIYEIAPEDVALCEFVDASKMPIQQIVRDGLDFLIKNV